MSQEHFVIAEIGCTHIGDLERAKRLARLAKLAGADCVKIQKRNPEESVNPEIANKPHPNQIYSYGDTYLEHRKNLELNIDQCAELQSFCKEINIEFSSSVWDFTSADEIISLNPKFIKIPSAINHRYDLLEHILSNFDGHIHISLGMTTHKERQKLTDYIRKNWSRFVVYHCTSGYPVPFDQLYLKEIEEMVGRYLQIGFSNHGYGIAMEPVAYALGARYFERHFIDDRTFRHTDAACSLEPDGLRRLCRDLNAVAEAFQDKPEKLIDIEAEQRNKLRY